MKIIINSRKYKLDKQFEMLDIGTPDQFESEKETLKALGELDKIAENYKKSLIKDEPIEPFPDRKGPRKTGAPVARP